MIGGTRLRYRPPFPEEEFSLAAFCEDLARYREQDAIVRGNSA